MRGPRDLVHGGHQDTYGVQQLKEFCGTKGLEYLHTVDPIDVYAAQQ